MLRIVVMALVAVSLTACSSFSRRTPNQQQDEMKVVLKDKDGNVVKDAAETPKTMDGKEVTKITPDAEAGQNPAAEEVKEAVSAAADHIAATHGKEGTARKVGSVPAYKALGWLKNGNTRFTKGRFRADGVSGKDRKRLAAAEERPHSIIVGSSDSRVPPEIIFDQKLGEVFVVRGSVAASDLGLLSSVEYGVLDLGPNLIVVLGNNSKDSWEHVDRLAQELQDRSEILRDAVASGDVKIVTAMYNLESGRVDWR